MWDEERSTLFWVDIITGKIHRYCILNKITESIELNEMIGAIALCNDGNLVAALRSGFAFINLKTNKIIPINHPEATCTKNRFNDGKCDPLGNFWAGTMALNEKAATGNLYRLGRDLKVEKIIPGVTISNGLAWSQDAQTMYYIDTPTQEVVAYDYNADLGTISNRRSVVNIPSKEGYPDGMTIDNEGMLWIAHWGGSQVARWNPKNGKKLISFTLPATQITSCTFGGPKFEDLYVTSATVGLSDVKKRKEDLAGSLFVIENCGFKGQAPKRFLPATIQK